MTKTTYHFRYEAIDGCEWRVHVDAADGSTLGYFVRKMITGGRRGQAATYGVGQWSQDGFASTIDPEVQRWIFEILGVTDKDAMSKFDKLKWFARGKREGLTKARQKQVDAITNAFTIEL